ncbi:MAG TPA: response regulator transcription factor [Candidatus Acidoferrales bacterium]|nr:response regulator transcription factor [Candidatus Acidoferrales bacterium]
MIRVLIAAKSAVVRAGLEALLASSPGIAVAGSDPDLSGVEALRPDVVLAAYPPEELPAPTDSQAGTGRAGVVVLLTSVDQPVWTPEALRLGVRALLPRDAGAAEILAAVEAAANGMAVLDPRELETLLAGAAVPAPATGETRALTARELEVLRMMAEGAANKTIAWKLNISEHTAKFHVASILTKLNASTRTEAVTVGIRRGLILL